MPKYVIKNCPARFNRLCTVETDIKRCADIPDCLLKRIAELTKVIDTPCDSCDGIGYFDGCKDDDCSFYRLTKIQRLLEIEEIEQESEEE